MIFWGESTNIFISLVWILRTFLGTKHVLYAVNGVVFALTFIPIRTVVMAYYIHLWIPSLYQNSDECFAVSPCGISILLVASVYGIGLVWVPQVYFKVSRGFKAYLNPKSAKN